MKTSLRIAAGGLALALIMLAVQAQHTARAQDSVEKFYRGKSLIFMSAFGPKGGYSALTRLASQYLPKHLPGEPRGITQFKPGAAGNLQAQFLYNIASRDGSVIGLMYDGIPTTQVMEPEKLKLDARQFIPLGSLNRGLTGVLGVFKTTGIETIADAKQKEAIFGAVGVNSSQYVVPHVMNRTVGTKFKLIPAYKGAADIFLAMEQGELNAIFTNYITIVQQYPQWIGEDRLNWLGQLATEPHPDLKGVPMLYDLPESDIDKAVVKFLVYSRITGKTFIAPPGVPANRVAALRAAFAAMVEDKDFQDKMQKMKQDLEPRTWQQARDVILATVNTSPEVVSRLQELTEAKK